MREINTVFKIIMAALLLISGIILFYGGVKLLLVGGSWYYLLAGIALIVITIPIFTYYPIALYGYAAFLFCSTLWAIHEVGLNWWQLVPRLWVWYVFGLLLLIPAFCHVVRPYIFKASAILGLSAIFTTIIGISALFMSPG